ncbi:hypothetical protein VaNZ11_014502, partial [Volvox africanus]
ENLNILMQRNLQFQSSRFGGSSDLSASTFNGQPTTVNSESHPITVSWIPPCEIAAGGRLGLTFCPGKHISARDGTQYCRDLRTDLARLRLVHGVHTIVCLLPEAELRYLKVRSYAAAVEEHGMEYLHLPIIEMAAPRDVSQAASVVDAVADRLQEGRTVVMHCKAGVGRAGMMAACVLVRLGVRVGPAEAIAAVRQHRRGAVESRRQEEFVAVYCSTFECRNRTKNAMSAATVQGPHAVMTLPSGGWASNVNSGAHGKMVPGDSKSAGEG